MTQTFTNGKLFFLETTFVVVVGLVQKRLGLAVDELLGQQDIVTNPLSGRLRGVPGVSGA